VGEGVLADRISVPANLQSKVPPGLLYMVQIRWFLHAFMLGVLCFIIGGMIVRIGNGWIYVGSVVSPLLGALYFVIKTLNPYHTPAANFSGMTDLDRQDPTARRLVALVQSPEARRFLFVKAMIVSGLLLVSLLLIFALQPRPLNWTLQGEDLQWFFILTFLCAVGASPIYLTELLIWSFRNWERRLEF